MVHNCVVHLETDVCSKNLVKDKSWWSQHSLFLQTRPKRETTRGVLLPEGLTIWQIRTPPSGKDLLLSHSLPESDHVITLSTFVGSRNAHCGSGHGSRRSSFRPRITDQIRVSMELQRIGQTALIVLGEFIDGETQ